MQKKTYTVSGNVTMNGMPLANVIVQLSADLMATTTDEDGKFVFYDVEPAQHSLTAIKSDKVIGYLSFELKKDSKTDISLNENGTYTVLIGQNSAGIELHLELNEENGVIAPVGVKKIHYNLWWLWLLLLLIIICIVVLRTLRRKKAK